MCGFFLKILFHFKLDNNNPEIQKVKKSESVDEGLICKNQVNERNRERGQKRQRQESERRMRAWYTRRE